MSNGYANKSTAEPGCDKKRADRMEGALRLPYAHLNLRRNPFGELNRSERRLLAVAGIDELAERLDEPGLVVQLIGGSGRGKTSQLLALHRHFSAAAFVKIRPGENLRGARGHPLFIDDAHMLSPQRRRRLFGRTGSSFAITTHDDLSAEIAELGLRCESRWPGSLICPPFLDYIFSRRIEAARRRQGPLPRVSRNTIEDLIEHWGHDVRSMELDLYRAIERMEEMTDVEV